MKNKLFEFVNKKVREEAKVILIGKKELKWVLPQGVYQIDSLNDNTENALEATCGKYRRMLSNNIKLQDLELIDGIELHCQGGIIEDGSIWISKDSKISDETYQLLSKAKCFIPILYEDDIYSDLNSLKEKWGKVSEEYLVTTSNDKAKSVFNNINVKEETLLIYLSNY